MNNPDSTQREDATPTSPPTVSRGASPTGAPHLAVVLSLLFLYGVLALWNAPRRDFWEDEVGHALVTRQMERALATPSGWLTPTLDGREPYLAKPPLTYWLSALTHLLTGIEPRLSYRIPAGLFAVLGLWLTFHLGRRLFGGGVGFLAMSVQATTWLFFLESAWLGSDLEFAVCCQLSLTGFVLAAEAKRPRLWRGLAWVGLAGAALTKSLPLAAVLVFGCLLLYFFFGGGVSGVKSGFRHGWSKGGVLLFLFLAAPWYVAVATLHGVELLGQHVSGQHLERLVEATESPRPLYYYLLLLPLAFLPWSLFVPLGLYHGKDRMTRKLQRLAVVWALFPLILLSAVSSKHIEYLLPLWPALALLITAAFFETGERFSLWEGYLGENVFRVVPHLLKLPLILAVLVGGGWLVGTHRRIGLDATLVARLDDPENHTRFLYLVALAVVTGAGMYFWTASRVERLRKAAELPRAIFETACATLFLFFVISFFTLELNVVNSARPLLDRVRQEIDANGSQLATYGALRPPELLYYLDRDVRHFAQLDPEAVAGSKEDEPRKELEQHLQEGDRVYVLAAKTDLAGLEQQFPLIYRANTKSLLRDTGISGRLGKRGEYVLLVSGGGKAD